MKRELIFAALTIFICLLIFIVPAIGLSQETNGISPIIVNKISAGFFETFLKTPFVIFTSVITFVCCLLSGFFEFFGFLFSGFNYKFPVTHEIAHMGWKTIVNHWWWERGVTWHLIVSLFIWLGAFSGGGRRR